MKTTVIGSFPYKNEIPNWFRKQEKSSTGMSNSNATTMYTEYMEKSENEREILIEEEINRIIKIHEDLDFDIFTDGEVGRENYVHFILRKWSGVNFTNLKEKTLRNGAYTTKLPVITNKLQSDNTFSPKDWLKSAKFAKNRESLKYTLPGPMTIFDTVVNDYYQTEYDCLYQIAILINKEMQALQECGCKYIQLDEPVYARYPGKVLKWGKELLEICFKDIHIHKSLHICCGYPDELEQTDYLKSDKNSYHVLAPILDDSIIDSISIEDAHCKNDLETLLPMFKNKIVILGVVKISTVALETPKEIVDRLVLALKYIDYNRLWISPDCGLGMLPIDIATAKLQAISTAFKMCKNNKTQFLS